MLKVITESGAIYYVAENCVGAAVMGGSKELQARYLWRPMLVGRSMQIYTPERISQNPDAIVPGVFSTTIVSIEEMDDETRS